MALFYAGIDEAGYGPLLGPLCVGCTVFRVDEGAEPTCLWRALSKAVCRSAQDKKRRIAVADSKKLKMSKEGAGHPLRYLERGVIAFAAAVERRNAGEREGAVDTAAPVTFDSDLSLLEALGAPPEAESAAEPPLALPVGNEAVQLRIAAADLRVALARAGIAVVHMRVQAISPREFNSQADRVQNKATINFMAAMRHVDRVRRAAARHGAFAHIALDQHGGRRHYVRPLLTSFPDAKIRVLEESDTSARYQLDCPAGDGLPAHQFTVSFQQGGEDQHLPIALASMAAKFARELHMRRLNAFFAKHVPELKQTAGYYLDGKRFLEDVGPVVERLGLDRSALVRSR